MTTRGYYCFKHRGLYYVFYNHFDSYDLGEKMKKELHGFTMDDIETIRCCLNLFRTMEEYEERWKIAGEPFRSTGFDGLLNAASHPEDYDLLYVGADNPNGDMVQDGMIEYICIADLDSQTLLENNNVVYNWK